MAFILMKNEITFQKGTEVIHIQNFFLLLYKNESLNMHVNYAQSFSIDQFICRSRDEYSSTYTNKFHSQIKYEIFMGKSS